MSAFSPLNLVQDSSASKKDLEEEHTRELEVENAYKTYQNAILLQSQQRWTEAYAEYKRLANSAVVMNHFYEEVSFIKGFQNGGSNLQPDELSFVPQNVKKIRFLFFRNRSFLHFNILKAGSETVSEILATERMQEPDLSQSALEKDLFYTMLDGFVNCLVYDEADESILRILFDLYTFLGAPRLAKFTLEYAVSSGNETDDTVSALTLGDWAKPLWDRYGKDGISSESENEKLNKKLHFLLPLKADFMAQASDRLHLHSLNVSLKPNASWIDIIHGVNSALKETQDKERVQDLNKIALKHINPYLASETTLDNVKFAFKSENHIDEPANEMIIIDDAASANAAMKIDPGSVKEVDVSTEQQDSVNRSEGEKSSMRLSKRLNPGDSAPVYADDIQLVRRYFVETEMFFGLLNESFKPFFQDDPPVLQDIVGHILNTDTQSPEPAYLSDFLQVLNEWKTQKYDAILFPEASSISSKKSKSDTKKLIEVLTSFGDQFNESAVNFPNVNSLQDSLYITDFLAELYNSSSSVDQVKLKILSKLMETINTTFWDSQLHDCISDWVMQLESDVFKTHERCLALSGTIPDFSLATGIYEILINAYITTKEVLEQLLETGAHTNFVKSVKANYNAIAIEFMGLKVKIEKWSKLFKDAYLRSPLDAASSSLHAGYVIRYFWATNYYISSQSFSWKEKNHVLLHLQALSDSISSATIDDRFHIAYPNLPKIGEFTPEGLQKRLSTSSILATFSKILDSSDSESISTNDTISLLESILFEEESSTDDVPGPTSSPLTNGLAGLDKVSLSSVREFFYGCPVDLKLSLWNILFSYYQKESFSNFQKGLEHYLSFILQFLSSPSYTSLEEDKNVLLLGLISTHRKHLATFLQHLSESKWQLPSDTMTSAQLKNISKIFELCYTFSLHEEAALYTSRKVSLSTKSEASFEYFKDYFIDSITMLSVYCFNYIKGSDLEDKDTHINNILRLMHNQLGLRHLCDSSKGLFLKFAEDALVTLGKVPETELTQIMSCRYHYRVKLNGQFPVDHYTVKSADLNKQSAEELALFILPLCFRTNPLTHTPRNDLKQVVDDLFEIIGDPVLDHDRVLSGNLVTIERFIENTFLGSRFIKESFYGLRSLDIRESQHKNKVAEKGLYFLEAVLLFNTYKMRKKIAQSRTVELERIVTILTYDLVYGSDRVESWILLAQAYGYMVEDDLIWTSDKINAIDRKIPTANLQRQSLVCYLMAVSTITRQSESDLDSLKPVMNVLMNSFAKEVYSASRTPMDMLAFQVHSTSRFVRQNDQTFFLKMSENPGVSEKFCLILANKCLDLAVKTNSEDWNSLYYAAKVKAKLKYAPTEVLSLLARAITAAKSQSVPNDPILEPTYKYLSLLYKYVSAGVLSVEEGVKYFDGKLLLEPVVPFVTGKKIEIFQNIVVCLKKLLIWDKRGWYHKPAYLQAKITFAEFGKAHDAKEILSKYFTLKSNSKSFLQLWKPENERPGKHFVYMYQYTKFFILLLSSEQDLSSLTLLYPKLRRANSTMLSLNIVWEDLCTVICSITRRVIDIDSFHVRHFLGSTPYSTFMSQARSVVDTFLNVDGSHEQKQLSFLHVIADIRKLNNGFGPTALVDYTFSGIFIQIYRSSISRGIAPEIEAIPDSPSGKAKKLAKRDLFPFAVELTTKFKRDMDLVVKNNPDIFNKYVAQYEIEAKEALQAQERQRAMEIQAKELKFSRRFAEQILLRDQRKAMNKMLLHLVPTRGTYGFWSTPIRNTTQPPPISIDLCGPESIAAKFNRARQIARNSGLQTSSNVSAREIVFPSQDAVTNPNEVFVNRSVIDFQTQANTTTTGINQQPVMPGSSENGLSNNVGVFVPAWSITKPNTVPGQINFQGTSDDPVEIESEEEVTPAPKPKRRRIMPDI